MISNFVLRSKIDTLKKKKRELVDKKNQLETAFRGLGVSKQASWKQRTGKINKIDESLVATREHLGREMNKVEVEMTALNNELRKCYSEEEAARNLALIEVFGEIFTHEQMVEINKEAQRRMAGESGFKFSFSVKDAEQSISDSKRYRTIAKEQLEKMIEFRIMLTGLIEKGCAKFGDAEFLKFISPLNRLIIPLSDLENIVRKNNL